MEHLGLAASPVLEEASAGVAPAVPTNPARGHPLSLLTWATSQRRSG